MSSYPEKHELNGVRVDVWHTPQRNWYVNDIEYVRVRGVIRGQDWVRDALLVELDEPNPEKWGRIWYSEFGNHRHWVNSLRVGG